MQVSCCTKWAFLMFLTVSFKPVLLGKDPAWL